MTDFPTGPPDIADAQVDETLFTMHGNLGHVPATNRILANLRALATKLGSGLSAPGGTAALLRRSSAGQSVWGPGQAGDLIGGGTANRLLRTADGTAVTWDQLHVADVPVGLITGGPSGMIAPTTITDANVAVGAAIALAKTAHVGAGNIFKSNGTVNAAGQILTGDILAMAGSVPASNHYLMNGQIAQAYVVRSSAGMVAANAWSGDASGLNISITTYGGPVIIIVSATMLSLIGARYGRFAVFRNAITNSVGQAPHYFPAANSGQLITLIAYEPIAPSPGSYNYFFGAQSNEADNNIQWMADGYRTMAVIELKR